MGSGVLSRLFDLAKGGPTLRRQEPDVLGALTVLFCLAVMLFVTALALWFA